MDTTPETPEQLLGDVNAAYDGMSKDELAQVGVVLGATRMFRGARRDLLAYVSMPITTGKRQRDVFVEHGVTDAAGLAAKLGKDALYRLVIAPNVSEGIAFADRLGLQDRSRLFMAPSVFEAKPLRWTQPAYMSLWYRVLGEMAGRHYLMDGWEYSTGGVKEVFFTMCMRWNLIRRQTLDMTRREFNLKDFMTDIPDDRLDAEIEAMRDVRVYDGGVREIHLDEALIKVVAALTDLRDAGLPHQELLDAAWRLMRVPNVAILRMPGPIPKSSPWPFTPGFLEARRELYALAGKPMTAQVWP